MEIICKVECKILNFVYPTNLNMSFLLPATNIYFQLDHYAIRNSGKSKSQLLGHGYPRVRPRTPPW